LLARSLLSEPGRYARSEQHGATSNPLGAGLAVRLCDRRAARAGSARFNCVIPAVFLASKAACRVARATIGPTRSSRRRTPTPRSEAPSADSSRRRHRPAPCSAAHDPRTTRGHSHRSERARRDTAGSTARTRTAAGSSWLLGRPRLGETSPAALLRGPGPRVGSVRWAHRQCSRVAHVGHSHFAPTSKCPIRYIMSNHRGPARAVADAPGSARREADPRSCFA
jgi:hypothetical protein